MYVLVAGLACRAVWQYTPDTGGIGGSLYADLLSQQACEDTCVSLPGCVGADIDLNPGHNLCWLHMDLATLTNTWLAPNVTNARLLDRCALG